MPRPRRWQINAVYCISAISLQKRCRARCPPSAHVFSPAPSLPLSCLCSVNHFDFHFHGVLIFDVHFELFNGHIYDPEWHECKHHFVVVNDNNSVLNIL